MMSFGNLSFQICQRLKCQCLSVQAFPTITCTAEEHGEHSLMLARRKSLYTLIEAENGNHSTKILVWSHSITFSNDISRVVQMFHCLQKFGWKYVHLDQKLLRFEMKPNTP